MLSNFQHNFNKKDVLLLGTQAARSKLSDHIVTADGLSVPLCAPMKEFGLIIDSRLLFEAHVNNIARIIFFSSLHDAEK